MDRRARIPDHLHVHLRRARITVVLAWGIDRVPAPLTQYERRHPDGE
ncbi:hypothetical protein [Nocardia sp. NPDC005998]